MENSRPEIQPPKLTSLASTFRIIERNTYLLFLSVVLGTSFFSTEIVKQIGQEQYTNILKSLEQIWPKFLAESTYLTEIDSELLLTYQLTQMFLTPLSCATAVFLYFFYLQRAKVETSDSFVWQTIGVPYVGLFAALFTYLVFFNVMKFSEGLIASRLYGTHLLYFWIPLTYVVLISFCLRLTVLLKNAVQRKKDQ